MFVVMLAMTSRATMKNEPPSTGLSKWSLSHGSESRFVASLPSRPVLNMAMASKLFIDPVHI